MAYEFQAIDTSVFDFHLTLDPLINSALLNPAYSFLSDPVAYQQQYVSSKSVTTGKLTLTPLRWRALTHHHYWKYYQTIWPSGTTYDFWKLQMPFIGKLGLQSIELHTPSPNFSARVRINLFVTAIGFSTNINISLRGVMSPSEVITFMEQLTKKGAALFVVDGKPKNMAQVFEYCADLLRHELYVGKAIDLLRINKHLMMSLASFTGPIVPYDPDLQLMSAADRGLFHGMLRGTSVKVPEVIDLEQTKKFLLTQFRGGSDFAISYFDIGTLLFMQNEANYAARQRRVPSKMKCLAANIRNYLLTSLTLFSFYRDSQKAGAQNTKIKELRKNVLVTLREIPNVYLNELCQSFHSNFKALTNTSSG